ncbi:hypothetical protein Bca52824_039671 [Brassica carinata]|uniref:DUF4283 domain-containing protein n=1 Tax=Brassica carinata TaxID=52824 RepID=A0A8X7RS17_BRACI|nr:hypothetical protein Bca52824_039671 [Brassica carinata]
MASSKGKGILYEEDDDEPILLPDQADDNLIKEYSLSLIGKILNPKKQNVERLIVAMPEQWGMADKISACDLGNGRFLFNFDNEEDLNSVLSQGPFHHNYCMFVLVRWELVVDENYPSMVPFWIQLQGIPLHLCTEQNLEANGDRLGKLELIDAVDGRIKVTMDSSKPLKFTRKLQTKKKEDITIKLFYEKLFKHCSTCGLMTHENQDCLPKKPVLNQLASRENVFDRVRPPRQDVSSRGTEERGKDEASYKSLKDGASSTSRVQRSSHSSRVNRTNSARGSRYNPYSYVRGNAADKSRGPVWKEKQHPLRIEEPVKKKSVIDTAHTAGSPVKSGGNRGKNVVEPLGSSQQSNRVDVNIDALNEHEPDEDDQAGDAEMQDVPIGNELMVMEEDDLLEEDLNQIEIQERVEQGSIEPDGSILMIEAKDKQTIDDNEDYAKALTRTVTRSLFTTQAASCGIEEVQISSEERYGGCQTSAPISSMKTLRWNCRGIENDLTVRRLKEMCQKHRP